MTACIEIPAGLNVGGRYQAGYEHLVVAFTDNFARELEAGAACAIIKDGVLIADLWGGVSHPQDGKIGRAHV